MTMERKSVKSLRKEENADPMTLSYLQTASSKSFQKTWHLKT